MSEQGIPPPEPPLSAPADRARPSVTLSVPRLPRWLALAALAVIPALVVGLAVYFIARGSSGGTGNGLAASIVDGFLRLGGTNDDAPVRSYVTGLPPGYPGQFPVYPNADLIASFSMSSSQGVTYFGLYSSPDPVDKVQSFYADRLDMDPWQLTAAQNSGTSSGVRFTQPANPDLEGSISVNHSDLDPRSTIYVSIQDSSPNALKSAPSAKFTPSPSLALPATFPNDVPIFAGKDTIVTDTLFQRDPGTSSYLLSFLTKSGQSEVIDYYKAQFQKKGWTVTDSADTPNTSFAQAIDFQDGPNKALRGNISADVFPSDRNYTKVDLEVHVAKGRSKSN